MKFPRLVYKNTGPIERQGGTYDCVLVLNEVEYDAKIKAGWLHCIGAEPITPEAELEEAPPTRSELEAKATELGLKFDRRMGDKKILAMITKAMEG